jgi:hypothetical protein
MHWAVFRGIRPRPAPAIVPAWAVNLGLTVPPGLLVAADEVIE